MAESVSGPPPRRGPQPLVLGSTSSYRAELLSSLGVAFETRAPGVDERAERFAALAPRELAVTLARAKAESVLAQFPDALVLGSDQVCALGDRRFDKPGTPERAVETLLALEGRTHTLWTAVCLVSSAGRKEHLDETRLTMETFGRAALERYVEREAPLDCAGAYKLEGEGAALFARVDSQDASAVVGLPKIALARLLRELGWSLP